MTPKRLSDTGLKRQTYRAATAMECLVGWAGMLARRAGTISWPPAAFLAAFATRLLGQGAAPPCCSLPGGPTACLQTPPQAGYLYLSDPERLHDMMGLLGLGDAPGEGDAAAGVGGGQGGSSGSGGGSSSGGGGGSGSGEAGRDAEG